MAKTKISEYSSTSASNTDIANINIAEGCSPANVNNAIRTVMAQLKDQQAGTSGDSFTVGGNLSVTGTSTLTGSVTAAGGVTAPITSSNATITGGTITGITDLTVADGGTGASSITANSVILGNGSSTLSGNLVAPSTTGNVLTSNGTTWASSTPAIEVPSGAVMHFAMSSAPTGWLKANGSAISRSTYASLFSAIGTTFGSGDGSTTFNVPDLRAEFVRGWDDSRGVDSGRTFGSAQDATGISDQVIQTVTLVYDNADSATYNPVVYNSSGGLSGTNRTISQFKVRPRNIALLACIKV